MIFQPELEALAVEERSALQRARLGELLERLRRSESPFWREKLAGVREGAEPAELPFGHCRPHGHSLSGASSLLVRDLGGQEEIMRKGS